MAWLAVLLGPFFLPPRGQAQDTQAHEQLCLRQVHESSLMGFDPVGLSISDEFGPDPAITMWSRSELLVVRVSGATGQVLSEIRADAPPGVEPLVAAVTDWNTSGPVVEILDPQVGDVWILDLATRMVTRVTTPNDATLGSSATRTDSGWVHVQKVTDLLADTSRIVLFGPGLSTDFPGGGPHSQILTLTPQRGIERLLHLRAHQPNGYLVQEAGLPFATIYFTDAGTEAWRVFPDPVEMRRQLEESDLRYVIATPAIAVESAILNTFVALRSGHRITALRSPDRQSVRYRAAPDGLAFLGAIPSHRLLVGTRARRDYPYTLHIFRWRWIDQGQSCS